MTSFEEFKEAISEVASFLDAAKKGAERERKGSASKRSWERSDPERKLSQGLRTTSMNLQNWEDPEYEADRAEDMRARATEFWKDPEYRAKALGGMPMEERSRLAAEKRIAQAALATVLSVRDMSSEQFQEHMDTHHPGLDVNQRIHTRDHRDQPQDHKHYGTLANRTKTKVEKGQRFGKLVVVDPMFHHGGQYKALLRCDCGTENIIRMRGDLKDTSSCGCARRRNLAI